MHLVAFPTIGAIGALPQPVRIVLTSKPRVNSLCRPVSTTRADTWTSPATESVGATASRRSAASIPQASAIFSAAASSGRVSDSRKRTPTSEYSSNSRAS